MRAHALLRLNSARCAPQAFFGTELMGDAPHASHHAASAEARGIQAALASRCASATSKLPSSPLATCAHAAAAALRAEQPVPPHLDMLRMLLRTNSDGEAAPLRLGFDMCSISGDDGEGVPCKVRRGGGSARMAVR